MLNSVVCVFCIDMHCNVHTAQLVHIIISHHIIWICYGAPIRSSEAPYKVQYRLNSTTNR